MWNLSIPNLVEPERLIGSPFLLHTHAALTLADYKHLARILTLTFEIRTPINRVTTRPRNAVDGGRRFQQRDLLTLVDQTRSQKVTRSETGNETV